MREERRGLKPFRGEGVSSPTARRGGSKKEEGEAHSTPARRRRGGFAYRGGGGREGEKRLPTTFYHP